MRLARLLRWLVATSIAFTLSAGAQPREPALDPQAEAVLAQWLGSTCLADDAPRLRATLTRFGPALAPALRRAAVAGPPPGALAAVREAAAARHRARAGFSWDGIALTGVSRAALARFAAQPQRDFVEDQVRRYVLGWRANAVAALGEIGQPDDRAMLRRRAADARDPLAPAARAALQADTPR